MFEVESYTNDSLTTIEIEVAKSVLTEGYFGSLIATNVDFQLLSYD